MNTAYLPEIRLPAPPRPGRKGIDLGSVAQRWRCRRSHARYILQQAGVALVPVELPPVEGVALSDLLAVEEKLRRTKKSVEEEALK